MKITNELLLQGMSVNGSWSVGQMAALSIQVKGKKGWKRDCIGKEISQEQIDRFLSLRDHHLKKKSKLNTYQSFLKRAIAYIEGNSYETEKGFRVIDVDDISGYLAAYVTE